VLRDFDAGEIRHDCGSFLPCTGHLEPPFSPPFGFSAVTLHNFSRSSKKRGQGTGVAKIMGVKNDRSSTSIQLLIFRLWIIGDCGADVGLVSLKQYEKSLACRDFKRPHSGIGLSLHPQKDIVRHTVDWVDFCSDCVGVFNSCRDIQSDFLECFGCLGNDFACRRVRD